MANTWTTLLDAVYPTGTLYFSTDSTSPATRFGGTWTQVKDAFIAAKGSAYITGTVAAYSGNKAMTVDQMPAHNHTFSPSGNSQAIQNTLADPHVAVWDSNAGGLVAGPMNTTGGGQNFAPYYYSTYIWRRTA